MPTTWLLVGAVTDGTARARGEIVGTSARLALSASPSMTAPTFSDPDGADANGIVGWELNGLTPGQRYYAALEVDSILDLGFVTQFVTDRAAPGKPADFTMMFTSCAPGTGNPPSTHKAHDAIAARACDTNFHLGDFGYPNITVNDPELYRSSWRAQLSAAKGSLLVKSAAFEYVYDDHDYGANDSDGSNPAKAAATAAYRQLFPYTLRNASGSIERIFTKGRFRFIVTDQRYNRSLYSAAESSTKTILGLDQRQWFIDQCVAAKNAGLFPVWISSQAPWVGLPGDTKWGSYTTERTWIWNQLAANGITNLICFAGDIHSMGFRKKVDYSDSQTAPVRCYAASGLDPSGPGLHPGPWDAISAGGGQYAVLTVVDHTTWAEAKVDFYNVNATTGVETRYFGDAWTYGTPPPAPGIYRLLRDSDGKRVAAFDNDGKQRHMVHG